MAQPQTFQTIPADRPLPERVATMTIACADVSGLSCGFSLRPGDEVSMESLYGWYEELRSSTARIEQLITAREAAIDEARYALMEQEAA